MVEKEAAAAVRVVMGLEEAALRAIGLTALQLRPARCRRLREAELHRLRLKADILELASVELEQPQRSSEEERRVSYACLQRVVALDKIKLAQEQSSRHSWCRSVLRDKPL